MKIDLNALRATTQEAIAQGQKNAADKKAQDEEQAALRQKEAELLVEKTLAQVPRLCQQAAEAGQSKAGVYRLRSSDYIRGEGPHPSLQGVGHLISKALQEAGFRVTLEYGWDGGGMDSWWDIVVHW